MARKEIDDKFTPTNGQDIDGPEIDAYYDGTQLEFEERMEAWSQNGIESGGALSIVSTDISIAAGVFWVEGRKFEPAPSTIPFDAGDASNTYFLWVDPTDIASPYKKGTSAPGNGFLLLGQVAWDGASVLSALVDYGRQGIVALVIPFNVVGAVAVDEIGFWINPGMDGRGFWIEGVKGSCEETGSANSTDIDVKTGAGGSEASILSSGTLLSIDNTDTNGAVISGTEPDQNRLVAAGQKLIAEVTAIATSAADLCLIVFGRWV